MEQKKLLGYGVTIKSEGVKRRRATERVDSRRTCCPLVSLPNLIKRCNSRSNSMKNGELFYLEAF